MGRAKVGSRRTTLDQFQSAVDEVLDDYLGYVSYDVLEAAVHKTAEETSQEIAEYAPKASGIYANAITYGHSQRIKGVYTETVYTEAPEYRLAHLLENGHAKRNGGRTGKVEGIPHWSKGEANIPDRLVRNIKERL